MISNCGWLKLVYSYEIISWDNIKTNILYILEFVFFFTLKIKDGHTIHK